MQSKLLVAAYLGFAVVLGPNPGWAQDQSALEAAVKNHACPGNPASVAKVELGKMLYFDPRLSASHVIGCNTCHNLGLGGADAEPAAGEGVHAAGWQSGP